MPDFNDLIAMLALGIVGGFIALKFGQWLPDLGRVITSFGWTIIIVTALGIILSLTPLSDLEKAGASHIGNFFLYFITYNKKKFFIRLWKLWNSCSTFDWYTFNYTKYSSIN